MKLRQGTMFRMYGKKTKKIRSDKTIHIIFILRLFTEKQKKIIQKHNSMKQLRI